MLFEIYIHLWILWLNFRMRGKTCIITDTLWIKISLYMFNVLFVSRGILIKYDNTFKKPINAEKLNLF